MPTGEGLQEEKEHVGRRPTEPDAGLGELPRGHPAGCATLLRNGAPTPGRCCPGEALLESGAPGFYWGLIAPNKSAPGFHWAGGNSASPRATPAVSGWGKPFSKPSSQRPAQPRCPAAQAGRRTFFAQGPGAQATCALNCPARLFRL